MKNYCKKFISVLLSLLVLSSLILPCAYALDFDNEEYIDYFLVSDENTSSSGYSETKIVTADGEESELAKKQSNSKYSLRKSAIPSRYSSLDLGYVSPVKNQESTAVCWAFSSIASAEISLAKKGIISSADLSESHLAWFTHNSLSSNDNDSTYGDGTKVANPYAQGGNWYRSTFTLARGSGFALEKDFPYYASNVSQMSDLKESDRYASNYSLQSAYKLHSSDISSIKKAVMNEGSVMVGIYMVPAYLNKGADGHAYYQSSVIAANHEVTIVGWDDNFSVDNFNEELRPANPGAWLVKNSYGTDSGDKGFFWVSYEELSLIEFVAQNVTLKEEKETIYQYDGYGWSTGRAAKDVKVASQANVFTANGNEMINAVSFHTAQDNVSYKIEIYNDVTYGKTSPIAEGVKADSVTTGKLDFQGYYKIPLSRAISVISGENYAVVVTFTVEGEGNSAVLLFEGQDGQNDGKLDRHYSSKSGQSYYMFGEKGTWTESSANGLLNNVCIKAFTVPDNSLEIATAEEFNAFADSVSNGNSFDGKNVNLVNDIDFNGTEIKCVGTDINKFKGHFLGNGHVLKNGAINRDDDYIGIFSKIGETASVIKLGAENIRVNGVNAVGIICGQNEGRIKYCYSIGAADGESCVGGLVGINRGLIVSSYSDSTVTGDSNVGLLVGADLSGSYDNCVVKTYDAVSSIGNKTSDKILSLNAEDFSNGKAAFILDYGKADRVRVWTKNHGLTTFMKDKSEEVYEIELYSPSDYKSVIFYVTSKDNLKLAAENANPGYTPAIYSDPRCTIEYKSTPNSNIMLYAVWSEVAFCYHNDVKAVSAVAASCTDFGSREYFICLLCNEKYWDEDCIYPVTNENDIIIPLKEHYSIEWKETHSANCVDTGTMEKRCDLCNTLIETQLIPSLGHEYPIKDNWVASEDDPEIYIGMCIRNCGDFDWERRVKNATEITLSKRNYKTNYIKGKVAFTLEADIKPLDFTDEAKIVWSSSNTDVATVDENGNVTTHNKGNAVITVTVINPDGSKISDSCNLTVTLSFGQWMILIFLFGFLWYFV